MTRLESYLLADNSITVIDANTFDNALMLQDLDLSRNGIVHLEDIHLGEILPKLPNLHRLTLSGNPFLSRLENVPMPSASLEVLILNKCELNSFNGSVLRQWPRLRELHLEHNPIKWLKRMESDSVEYLNLKYCELDLLTNSVFTKMPRLQRLILIGNLQLGISSLISASLHHLDASLCRVTEPKLHNMTELLSARFPENRIEAIASNAFEKNAKLLTLDLSKNLVHSLNGSAFVGLDNVIEINLNYNYIKELSEQQFEKNFGLRRLFLSNNHLTEFVKLRTKSLEKFDVSFNEIHTIEPNGLETFRSLKFLNLSRNNLEIFQGQSSVTLECLDLSMNRLIFLDNTTFSSFPYLTFLSLSGNRLTQLSELLVFEYSPGLTNIYLADNPWECHCENKSLKTLYENLRVLAARNQNVVDLGKIRCNMRMSFSSLCWSRWYPVHSSISKTDSFNMILYAFMLILFLVMAVVGLVRYRLRIVKEKDRRRRMEEAREAREIQARLLRQHRESVIETERRRAEERELTRQQQRAQLAPPSYEEAIQLARSVQSLCSACSGMLPSTSEINVTPEIEITTIHQHDVDESEEESAEEDGEAKNETNNDQTSHRSLRDSSSSISVNVTPSSRRTEN